MLAKPVVVGPFTANFAEAMNCFLAADAMVVVQNPPRALSKRLSTFFPIQLAGEQWAFAPGIPLKPDKGRPARHAAIILDMLIPY